MWNRKRKRTAANANFLGPALSAAILGAGLAYMFDPERGRTRRARTRDQMAGAVRHSARRAARGARIVRAQTIGLSRRLIHAIKPRHEGFVDDVTLTHRVESELFREDHFAKGAINISAFEGTVILRGALKHPEEIRELKSRVARIPGVRRVESYLHLEGTPAPNKLDALEATHHGYAY